MTAHDKLPFHRSAFHRTMLGLSHEAEGTGEPDIFSQGCVEAFENADWDRFGYPFTQVFEAAVLQETAALEQIPYADLARLTHRPTAAMRRLGELLDNRLELDFVRRINLASALTSVARLDLAHEVLTEATELAVTDRDRFEAAWLTFVVSNRRDDGEDSATAFTAMRTAAGTGDVPVARVLDACTQGVVWYLKRKEISEEDFRWCVRTGNALAKRGATVDDAAVSSWYRGLAMLPAAKGMPEQTRAYMEAARRAAEETVRRQRRADALNLLKTYHESSLKEHMYVTRDRDAAVAAGRDLIALDPAWSVSYGELAEAHVRFGSPLEAAELYDQAVAAGPPYVGHHLLKSAGCWERADEPRRALDAYRSLARLVPGNAEVLAGGLRCARLLADPSASAFETALGRLGVSGTPR
ncbi:hypothetical protein [Streptomyces sp. TP-A0874]|uniref:hypothetical protein n=1 Tax=Streptomyces sp. TP-A0874 TaxID=549819 RepID=UPI000853598A|nr:hypothetical protein [Streptomyces sp. TP-A0874]